MTFEETAQILFEIQYKDWDFVLYQGSPMWLQVQFKTRHCTTGEEYVAKGRKWFLSPHMVKSEIVGTVFKAVLTAEEHEVRECFKWKGKAVYNPHIDVEALASVCETVEVRE